MKDTEREKLILDNLPFAYHIIHKQYPSFSKDEDVIQAAMLGLVKAANKYDETKGKFSTYAGVIIQNEIAKELKVRLKESGNVSLNQLMEGGIEW